MWITYSGYLFPTVGLTLTIHLKDMLSCKRYGLLSWFFLFFFFLSFFYFLFGIISNIRALQFECWEIHLSRVNKNKWANKLFPLASYFFVEIIFDFFSTDSDWQIFSTADMWIIQIKDDCWKLGTGELYHRAIGDNLWITWSWFLVWSYNYTLDTIDTESENQVAPMSCVFLTDSAQAWTAFRLACFWKETHGETMDMNINGFLSYSPLPEWI